MPSARSGRRPSYSFVFASFALALSGCGLIVDPDLSRLGLGDGGIDGGAAGDSGGVDAFRPDGETPVDANFDANCEELAECTDGTLEQCGVRTECTFGCENGASRCNRLTASNVALLFDEAADDITLDTEGEVLFDTGECESERAETQVISQIDTEGPAVCVLLTGDFRVAPGTTLRVVGRRPLIILAAGSVTIEEGGVLDVGARGVIPGAGGGTGARGLTFADRANGPAAYPDTIGDTGTFSVEQDSGGGGGALCGAGGGGGSTPSAAGGDGGDAIAANLLRPLVGGAGGGAGFGVPTGARSFGPGGAGGGAIQISAQAGISVLGEILAGGGGGRPGGYLPSSGLDRRGAGGGGGSGGAILLESSTIQLGPNSRIVTTGGSGGGSARDGEDGDPGADGDDLLDRAPGGEGNQNGGQSGGGAGAAGQDGSGTFESDENGGGGGGGVGCVVYRTLAGGVPTMALSRTSGSNAPSLSFDTVEVR